jgi:chromosome segregation ATPase
MPGNNARELPQLIQSAIQTLNQIQTTGDPTVSQGLTNASQSLQQLCGEFTSLQQNTSFSNAQTEQVRQHIAEQRNTVMRIKGTIEQVTDNVVQQYRSILGTNKEQFELLSSYLQQQTNSQAYQQLQTYQLLNQLDQLLNQLNGGLMDYSAGIEQSVIAQNRTQTPSSTDANFENDPAPHHLSP